LYLQHLESPKGPMWWTSWISHWIIYQYWRIQASSCVIYFL